jgi:hypothetical protein
MSEDLDELRKQTDPGTRAEDTGNEEPDLEDVMVDKLAEVESGEISKTLSVRDERLAALVHALEETGQLDDVVGAIVDQLDRDGNEDGDRSEFIRLALRLALEESESDALETARSAYARHASDHF